MTYLFFFFNLKLLFPQLKQEGNSCHAEKVKKRTSGALKWGMNLQETETPGHGGKCRGRGCKTQRLRGDQERPQELGSWIQVS